MPAVVVSVEASESDSANTVVALLMSQDAAATVGTVSAVSGSGSGTGAVSLLMLSPRSDPQGG